MCRLSPRINRNRQGAAIGVVGLMSDAKKERGRRHDAKRRVSQPWRKLYKTKQWQALRANQLNKVALCEECKNSKPSRLTLATVVHHKEKHEGNEKLFFDPDNLSSSCKPCHDGIEQQKEKRGYSTDVSESGFPTDINHPFNK